MNWIDLTIVLVVVLYAFIGWRRGFIFTLAGLISIAAAFTAALFLYRYAAPLFTGIGGQRAIANLTAFLLIFFAVDIIIAVIFRRLLRRMPRGVIHSPVNRVFGLLLGTLQGIVIAAVGIMVLTVLPFGIDDRTVEQSALGESMLEVGSWLERTVTAYIPEDVLDGLTFRTVPPEARERIEIPQTTNVRVNPQAERRMLELINQERTRRGLPALTMDPDLRKAARDHSQDMYRRGYFAHVNPDGQDAFDRMREEGITFITAGENLAMAPTVKIAHEGLMNSPGHRANILNRSFRKVGIGAYTNPRYGTVFTQNFTN